MDIFEAYDLVQWTKKYLKGLGLDFEIVKEQANQNRIVLFYKSKNGKDLLPIRKYGGRIIFEFRGLYVIEFDSNKNTIIFTYHLSGHDGYSMTQSFIDKDENGEAMFRKISNMMELMKIAKEWNDDFKNKMILLRYYPLDGPRDDSENSYLVFDLACQWNLNKSDTLDTFKKEFQVCMRTMLSQETRDLIAKLDKFHKPCNYL